MAKVIPSTHFHPITALYVHVNHIAWVEHVAILVSIFSQNLAILV